VTAQLGRLWGRWGRWAALIPIAAAVLLVAAFARQGVASGEGVMSVRMGGDLEATRVVVELGKSAKGRLISDASAPGSVVLALPGVEVSGEMKGRGAGLVKSWSVDEAAGAARLELALTGKAIVRRRFLLPPGDGVKAYRYVIDLEAEPASAAVRPTTATVASASSLAATLHARTGKRVVVIDPGHGGKDPGAAGAVSVEKDVTLAAARALKSKLERTGRYRVVLTRASDLYIPLETRVSIARKAGADLFISLHADSDADPMIKGASVYTLSEKGVDRAARKVMSGDNWFRDMSLPGQDPAVDRILLDLTQRATSNRSSAFARLLIDDLDRTTALLQRSHRDAGFVVLLAPDVPAVLLEMGFITNSEDEARLNDPSRRARLVEAVAEAVDSYFIDDRRPTKVVAAR
jgi:N-acetylmuramoyl-L-alanine amidase